MFYDELSFSQDLSGWDVRNIIQAEGMFANSNFNGSLEHWNLQNLYNAQSMFTNDAVFNQSLASWKTPALIYAEYAFYGTSALDQDFSGFDISKLQHAGMMFSGSGLSPENYSKLLNGWAASPHKNDVYFDAYSVKYDASGQAGRASLINSNWTIQDAGLFTPRSNPTITTLPTASEITYGQSLANSVLRDGVATVPGTFTFDSTSMAPDAGTYQAAVTFTPDNVTDFFPVQLTVGVNVSKAPRNLARVSTSNLPWNFDELYDSQVAPDLGSGSISYSVDAGSSQICSLLSASGMLTTLRAGNCDITAQIAEDDNYLAATYLGRYVDNAIAPRSFHRSRFLCGLPNCAAGQSVQHRGRDERRAGV
jgi:hypothetical protein